MHAQRVEKWLPRTNVYFATKIHVLRSSFFQTQTDIELSLHQANSVRKWNMPLIVIVK